MPYDLRLPRKFKDLWKVKIQDKELLYEEPHLTIWKSSTRWRWGLHRHAFLDTKPDPTTVPSTKPLVAKYVIAPICAPLFFAGFVLVFCTVSLARRESVFPMGPPWGMREPFATAALAVLCATVPLPYLTCVLRMNRGSTFLGYTRRFWRILVASVFCGALFVALVFAGVILTFFPN